MLPALNSFKQRLHKLPHWLWLTSLVIIAFSLRLYELATPLGDWHSFRQADTASVTREFVKHDYPIWEPHYHDVSDIPSKLPNPEGYRMVEFPIVNYLIAQLLRAVPQFDLVITSRLVSIGFSLISMICLYWFSFRLSRSKATSIIAALVFALMPFSIYYSRVILPEPALVMTQMIALTAFIEWLIAREQNQRRQWLWYLLSAISFSLSMLLKPMAVFYAPVYFYLIWRTWGWKFIFQPLLYIYGGIVLIPFATWRWWISHFPEGVPASDWLFNGNGIRLRPSWWWWLFADRISKLMLGYWGTVFLATGTLAALPTAPNGLKRINFNHVYLCLVLSMFSYLVVIATGNVQHDYYQVMLLPTIALGIARGIVWLIHLPKQYVSQPAAGLTVLVITTLSLMFGWYEVEGYFNINNWPMTRAGKRVREVTPPDALVIAPYNGDTAFLFQTDRLGWPIGTKIEEKIAAGADYYVTTSHDDEARRLMETYDVIEQTPEFIIIKLTPKSQ